jgi:putative ABC transport system substrate-binding protein
VRIKPIQQFSNPVTALMSGNPPLRRRSSRSDLICAVTILATMFLLPGNVHASDTIIVVPSRQGGVYQEFIESFEKSLESSKGSRAIAVRIVESNVLTRESYAEFYSQSRLIVTVGTVAARKVLELNTSTPALNTLIPRSSYRMLVSEGSGQNTSAIYLDQSLKRRFELVGALLPQNKNIGVVLGPGTGDLQAELKAVATSKGVTVKVETMKAGQRLVGPLNRALEDSDAFLAVADPVVSNRRTVQNLLLTTYRQRVPVIAYSRAYVKAGALAAVYSTPVQIGKQAGELVGKLVRTGDWSLPKPQYPKYFSVEINDQVAQSLGINTPSAADIEASLYQSRGRAR